MNAEKLKLLNDEEADQFKGGAMQMAEFQVGSALQMDFANVMRIEAGATTCNKAGDTIACNLVSKIVACAYEVGCQPNFSSSCSKTSFAITGCSTVTFS